MYIPGLETGNSLMSLLLYEGGWKKTLLKNKETRAQLGDRRQPCKENKNERKP